SALSRTQPPAAAAVALLAYLIVALIKPEKF
ncbi:K(+)-transporting ATPase subunit F, partial [Streptomyces sp. NPDC002265]